MPKAFLALIEVPILLPNRAHTILLWLRLDFDLFGRRLIVVKVRVRGLGGALGAFAYARGSVKWHGNHHTERGIHTVLLAALRRPLRATTTLTRPRLRRSPISSRAPTVHLTRLSFDFAERMVERTGCARSVETGHDFEVLHAETDALLLQQSYENGDGFKAEGLACRFVFAGHCVLR